MKYRTLQPDVLSLALPEGRMVGSKGHEQVRHFLLKRMKDRSLRPYRGDSFELTYEGKGQKFYNLVGVCPSPNPDRAPILIGAHYDSVIAAPCAEDNAAAVAVTLAAAEALQKKELDRDVVIAIFDAEEEPYHLTDLMGSMRFYEDNIDDRGIHAAIILEMVGHNVIIPSPLIRDKLPGLIFMVGTESHPYLKTIIRECPRSPKLSLIAMLNKYVGDKSDYAAFRKGGVPYVCFSCGRWPDYHQPTDTPDKLNYQKMEHVTDHILELTPRLMTHHLEKDRGRVVDPIDLESALFCETFKDMLPDAFKTFGLEKMETREDMDKFIHRLLEMGI